MPNPLLDSLTQTAADTQSQQAAQDWQSQQNYLGYSQIWAAQMAAQSQTPYTWQLAQTSFPVQMMYLPYSGLAAVEAMPTPEPEPVPVPVWGLKKHIVSHREEIEGNIEREI
jgi:hypothetical protein